MTDQINVSVMTDYRGAFWSSTRNVDTLCTMDVDRLVAELVARGCDVDVISAGDIDLTAPVRPRFLLYTSSESEEGDYKRFLEARVFGLQRLGYTPVPNFHFLLAHHDKVYMETLRSLLLADAEGQPTARTFGSFEEYQMQPYTVPVVLKPARGAGSRGVALARSSKEARDIAHQLSASAHLRAIVRERAKRRLRGNYKSQSLNLTPFIAQEFVPGLSGDFKVLRCGARYYAIARKNRPGDFRASGGGRLDYRPADSHDMTPILDRAWAWSEALGSPFVSMDVGFEESVNDGVPVLLEFQCVSFGPAGIENSVGYFTGRPGSWAFNEGPSRYEAVFAEAAVDYFRSAPGE